MFGIQGSDYYIFNLDLETVNGGPYSRGFNNGLSGYISSFEGHPFDLQNNSYNSSTVYFNASGFLHINKDFGLTISARKRTDNTMSSTNLPKIKTIRVILSPLNYNYYNLT